MNERERARSRCHPTENGDGQRVVKKKEKGYLFASSFSISELKRRKKRGTRRKRVKTQERGEQDLKRGPLKRKL